MASMYFVITIILTFHSSYLSVTHEYTAKTFNDTWKCHQYTSENKMELLTPHILNYGDSLKGFEFYCESRYAEEV